MIVITDQFRANQYVKAIKIRVFIVFVDHAITPYNLLPYANNSFLPTPEV